MPIPLRLSFLPPISAAGITIDPVEISNKKYDFLFGDDQIPVLHLSAIPGNVQATSAIATYKTSVSALSSIFSWTNIVIRPENLSQGGFYWTSGGDLSAYNSINVLNAVGTNRNMFVSGIGINIQPLNYSVTILEKTTAAIVLRSDEVRGPQLAIGLDEENHGAFIQGGKFSGFRFPRPLIFRFASPVPTEVLRINADSFVGINDSVFPPAKLTIRGNLSASPGLSLFDFSTGGGSISAVGNNVNFFGGPLLLGTNTLERQQDLRLVVIGSISATGNLSATNETIFDFLRGNLGLGTNTFEGRNLRLAVIGSVRTESGGLSVVDANQFVYLGSKLGVGPDSYTDAANGLTVAGTISARGTLSASGKGFNYFEGPVGINIPNTATSIQHFGQKLTVVGSISSTGSLSATNQNSNNFFGGTLGVGPGATNAFSQRLTIIGNVSSTGSLSATDISTSSFNLLAGRVGIGTNTHQGENLRLAVIGSISATGALSATNHEGFNAFRGYVGIGQLARQRYADRAFAWGSSLNIGSNFFNTLNIGNSSLPIVVGSSNFPYFYYTTTPTAWYSGTAPVGTSSIRDIAGDNIFIAIEDGSSNKSYISTTGISWSNGGLLPLTLEWGGIGYGNGRYVITSTNADIRTAYSTNFGTSWSLGGNLPGLGNWSKPVYNPFYNSWLCCRNAFWDGVGYSSDGISWIQKFVGLPLDWSQPLFVPPNFYVILAASDNKLAYSSDDGNAWTVINLPVSDQWNSITYGTIRNVNAVIITSLNSNKVLYSTDLTNWIQISNLPAVKNWTSLGYSNSGFLAVADDGTYVYGNFNIDDNRHLNVFGTVSATGALSASGPGHSFIGGPVIIGSKGSSATPQNDRPAYGQTLTVVGNISATGTLSAADTLGTGVSFLGGTLGIGTNQPNQVLTVIGNISSTGTLSANSFSSGNDFNLLRGSLGIGANAVAFDQRLTVVGNISATGALSATGSDFSFIGGQVMIGGKTPNLPVVNQNDRPAYGQKLTVVGLISSTGGLSATDSGGVNIFGALGIGTNTTYGQRLAVVGNISATGGLSATNDPAFNTMNYFAGQVGIGTNQIPDTTIQLAVIGSISATGSLSAMDENRFNFIGGSLQVGPVNQTTFSAPAFNNLRLTVVGNISAAGTLSATDSSGLNFIGNNLHVGPVSNNLLPFHLSPRLTVVGNISATGALSAAGDPTYNTMNYFGGRVGIGTNTMEGRDVQLAIIGSVSATGTLSAAGAGYSLFLGPVGIGRIANVPDLGQRLTVVGSMSASGTLSAEDISASGTNFIGGQLMIGGKTPTASLQNDRPAYGQKLTVVGNISSTGSLSATDPGGVSTFGQLVVGTPSNNNAPVLGQRLTITGNISATGGLSATGDPAFNTFNFFAGQVGIGTNQITDPSTELAVIGSISATGSLSAVDSTLLNYFGGTLQVGPIINFPITTPNFGQALSVVGNVSATGSLSAIDSTGTNVMFTRLVVGNPANNNAPVLGQRLTVVGNISSTGTLSATGDTSFNTMNYFAGRVGIGTNTFEGRDIRLTVIGNVSSTGALSATDSGSYNYFAGRVGIGDPVPQTSTLSILGSISATGNITIDTTDNSYLSGRLIISNQAAFGDASTVNPTLFTGLVVTGSISGVSLSARTICVEPVIYTYNTATITTLTLPTGYNYIKIMGIGGGGGAGSGRKSSGTAAAKYGGGGGGGGAYNEITLPIKKLAFVGGTQTISLTCGAGGAGGAAQTTDNTNGNNGQPGAATAVALGTVAQINPFFIARGGREGYGGTTSADTSKGGLAGARFAGGNGADPLLLTFATATEYLSYDLTAECADYGGSGGGAGGTVNAANNNSNSLMGLSALPGGTAGGNNQGSRNGQNNIAGANGVSIAIPTTAPVSEHIWGGTGGGGGGATITTTAAGAGGTGAQAGGGGGGGGASGNATGNSGAGGTGGTGYLRIIVF